MFPEPFVKRIQSQFSDGNQFLEALSLPSITSIRKHPVKGRNIPISGEEVPWCPEGLYLPERPVFTLDPHFHAGAYYVQESSSMFIHFILDQLFDDKNIRVLDLCAAPGGKSTLVASWLGGNGLLVSNEVIKSRSYILLENMIKWGYPNTWITNTDVHVLGGLSEFFDCVIIDAPCSGEGLFRKDKEAISEWSEANCDLCARRQRKIVADILPAVNVGGFCIYSTCTFNPAENDENLQWMLKEFPLELVQVNIAAYPQIKSTNGGYAFYPQLNKGEGFYCCILRKTGEIESEHTIRRSKINWPKTDVKGIELVQMVQHSSDFEWYRQNENIFGISHQLIDEWKELTGITKVLGGCLALGVLKGKDFIPDHALAMSILCNAPYPFIEVDKQNALLFLAKKECKIPANQLGWHTIRYHSSVLGFAKFLGNRFNNYYPSEWRIRMDV
jgi:16S rRNA C967 or C1407 C5-methylase (RsmB/RsmF family)/NOL1/NOP2/fmu family ribosome biogenesis protein